MAAFIKGVKPEGNKEAHFRQNGQNYAPRGTGLVKEFGIFGEKKDEFSDRPLLFCNVRGKKHTGSFFRSHQTTPVGDIPLWLRESIWTSRKKARRLLKISA
jgi:hypothetical protein